MSYPLTERPPQLGPHPFNHNQAASAEAEYDRLRALARRAQDPARRHQYNKQASEFIFRENNAPNRVSEDELDLHGQFVEEAEEILEARINHARSTGQSHLHVIVGKGNHSANHIQKLKPKVEQAYNTVPNIMLIQTHTITITHLITVMVRTHMLHRRDPSLSTRGADTRRITGLINKATGDTLRMKR
ncbi:MAG: hypothetical protein Q9208_007580 [Pyrenodesmia sp. 3 TL-2023]